MESDEKPGHLRFCKLAGCDNELTSQDPTRGIWANICQPCRKGETTPGMLYREKRGMAGKAGDENPNRQVAALPAGTLEAKAKAIVPLAKTLERKVGVSREAKKEAAAAVKEFSAALGELRDAAQALLNPVS